MRLLSAQEILDMVTADHGALGIANFEPEMLQHTSYYVRLGDTYYRPSDGIVDEPLHLGAEMLRFSPSEYLRVESMEHFRLDATVLGIIGGVSDSHRQGIALVSGQFIDPLFPSFGPDPAPLDFGLKNMSLAGAALLKGSPIAKVSFFDVTDTPNIELDPQSMAAKKFKSRKIPAPVTTLRPAPAGGDLT